MKNIEQYNFNKEDFDYRKIFINLSQEDTENIKRLRPYLENEIPKALEKFYIKINNTPETKKFFKDELQLKHAKKAQNDHWQSILNGKLDEDYVKRVERIGLVHAHIGLEPRWYIGGYSIVLEYLIKSLMSQLLIPNGFFKKTIMSVNEASECITSLTKMIMLEIDITISVYFKEAENMKKISESKTVEQQQHISDIFGDVLHEISTGNLTQILSVDVPNIYVPMKKNINNAVETLHDTLSNVRDSVIDLENTTSEINNVSEVLNKKTEEQSISIQRTAAAVEQITATVSSTSQRVMEANSFVQTCQKATENFQTIITNTSNAMLEIKKSSEEIKNITHVISEIALQTNILALNTGIEAARAGKNGHGFQILAQEIRSLSHQTSESSKNVKNLIDTSHEHVVSGVKLMEQTKISLENTVDNIQNIADQLNAISNSSHEENMALQEINNAINLIDKNTKQNRVLVEKAHTISEDLNKNSTYLHGLITQFTLN
jgi:methyl-accepting chemotaxis protein